MNVEQSKIDNHTLFEIIWFDENINSTDNKNIMKK